MSSWVEAMLTILAVHSQTITVFQLYLTLGGQSGKPTARQSSPRAFSPDFL
jgi:hypothetical protein